MAWSALTNPLSSAVTYDQSISARRQTSQVITGAGADNWFRGSPWSISCQMIPACLCLRNHFWEVWLIRILSLDLSNANSSSHPTQLICTFKVGLHFNPQKKQSITLPFLGPHGPLIEPSIPSVPSGGAGLLQIIIWGAGLVQIVICSGLPFANHQPLANNHLEGPASCKSGGTGLL